MSKWINPSAELIRDWAFDTKCGEPEQDWDIIIHDLPYESLYADLASDCSCPKAEYFLSLLYFTVGHSFRIGLNKDTISRIQSVRDSTNGSGSVLLYHFRLRVDKLLCDPSTFSYDKWCGGGYARDYQH